MAPEPNPTPASRWRSVLSAALALVALAAPAHALSLIDWNVLNYPGTSGPTRDPSYRVVLAPLSPDVPITEEQTSAAGIEFAPGGEVVVGPEFRTLEAAWMEGVAATARAGARIIVDDAFLGGAASQHRCSHRSRCKLQLQTMWR